jgi:predicted nucleic acid-binding protein
MSNRRHRAWEWSDHTPVGLTVYDASPSEDLAALAFTKKANAAFQLDFDDALHYATAKKHNFTLVSFDRDFDRTDLARKTPSDILSRYENNHPETH